MNAAIFQYLHSFVGQSVCLDSIIIFCAKYLPYLMVAALGLFLVFGCEKRRELKMVLCAVASAIFARLVITEIIRFFYYSPRPFIVYNFTPLIYDFNSSFPSGHAAFFFALAAAVFFFHKKWSIVYFLGAIIIVLSRIMAGIHWPMDIVGGAIVGIGSALFVYYSIGKLIRG